VFVIFFLAFFSKWFLARKGSIDFDSYGHLYCVKELKLQNGTPWNKIDLKCWESQSFSHPFLLHYFLSKLPFNILYKYQIFFNIIVDSFFTLFIYGTAVTLFHDEFLGILSALIYLFTPIWFSNISMGPRVNNFTPRLFTEVLYSINICVLLDIFNLHDGWRITISVLLTSIILLTSKFGLQVLVFSFPLFSIVFKDFTPIIILIISLILIIIISRGAVLDLFRSQFQHLSEYYRSNIRQKTPLNYRNRFLRITVQDFRTKTGLRKLAYNYLFYNSHTIIVLKMPVVIMFFLEILINPFDLQGILFKMFLVICVIVVIYMLVSLRSLLFLGEAERYLNHIAVVIVISMVNIAVRGGHMFLLYGLIAYGVCYYIIELILYKEFVENDKKKIADNEIEEVLFNLNSEQIVLSQPYHNFNIFRIMLNTRHKVIYPLHMKDSVRLGFEKRFEKQYPFLNLSRIREIIELTDLSVIVLYNPSEELIESLHEDLPGDWREFTLKNKLYRLYHRA
jgi:hypothetical protein